MSQDHPGDASLQALIDRLRARYPLLGVLDADERHGVAEVVRAARAAGIASSVAWAGAGDGVAMALQALAQPPETPRVLILPGGRGLLADFRLVRALVEGMDGLERAGQTVALVAPSLPDIPELARDLVRIPLALPRRQALLPLVVAALGPDRLPDHEGAVQALQGLTMAQARRALRRVRELPPEQALAELIQEKRELLAAAGVVEVMENAPGVSEIGGLDELKGWLGRQRLAFSQEARAYGLPLPRGVLLVGVQGCGKSLSAKATATCLGLPLLRLDLGRLHTADRVPDENLRHALAVAEAMAPVVLWIDEIDKAFASSAGTSSEAGARVFGSMLAWLGEQRGGVFVAATANRLAHLPAELMRKGRFDETFFVDVPDQQARAEILAVAIRRSGRDPEKFDLETVAKASERLTGAEVDQAVAEALQLAFCAGRQPSVDDFLAVLAKVVPFVETYDTQVRELRQWARRHCRNGARDRSLHELFAAARART